MSLSFHDKQHIQRMFVQEQRINAIFNQFVRAIAPEMRRWKDAGNKHSVWIRNSSVEKAIDRLLIQLRSSLNNEIKTNQKAAWMSAVEKNDKIVEEYIKGMAMSVASKEGMFKRNLDALTAIQQRVEDGLNLSKRVWNITAQTKDHIELFLESGLSTGRSAEAIGRDFRQLLRDPEKRFRRVRDAEGKLVLSQPMKNYNPGRGVYRSSRMNALRVAATETNIGYRLSDSERWKQLDFILGFEVRRSRNGHSCTLCDSLVGKYPKDFVFTGSHPFCICIAVPIIMSHEDFSEYLHNETIPSGKSIKDIPSGAKQYLLKNPNYKNSYYVRMNSKFLQKAKV